MVNQQTSSNLTHSDKIQLAVVTQQNKRLTCEILPSEFKHYQHQDELKILLNTAKQLKYFYFTVEQQALLFLPEKASRKAPRTFFPI